MNLKKLLIFMHEWGLFALLAVTLSVFVMAVQEALIAESGTVPPSIFSAILDTITSDSKEAEGWSKWMHGLVTVVIGWAAVRVYMNTAGLKWDTFAARWLLRDHIIVVAGRAASSNPGGKARHTGTDPGEAEADKSALAIDLAIALAAHDSVVLALPKVDEGGRERLWVAGVTVITENLAPRELLRAAGAMRARTLIAMRDHFGDNVSLTRAAVSPALGNSGLECKCMLEPLSVKRAFRIEDYFENDTLPRIRVFSEAELIARRLLRDYPPDLPVAMSAQGVHVLLVGLGSVGQAILLQLARMGHYRSGKKPKVTVVDRDVRRLWKQLIEAHPALEHWLIVETEEKRIEDVGAEELGRWFSDECPVSVVYICTKDEIANLRIARIHQRAMLQRVMENGGGAFQPHVVALDPAGGCVLSDFSDNGAHPELFHLFSLVRVGEDGGGATVTENLLSDLNDTWARLLHEDYCRENDKEFERNPTRNKTNNLPWESLTEDVRDGNRVVADHFGVKLRALGLRTSPKGAAERTVLNADEIEILADMEHRRWWADKDLGGWHYGEQTDKRLKINQYMLSYGSLTDEIKQYDRNSIHKMIEILNNEGLDVIRESAPRC